MTKRPFDPIPVALDDDDEDRRLAEYAKKSGIPEIKRPVSNDPKPTAPVSQELPLHGTVPEYVLKRLRVQAAEDRVSVRYLVLKALSDAGAVEIAAADLVQDRRGRRAK